MKVIRNKQTGEFKVWPREDQGDVIGLDTGTFDVYELIEHDRPSYDAGTHYLERTEVIDEQAKTVTRGWEIVEKPTPPDYKIWFNVQQFMAEFTMEEKAAVSMSADPIIAALRLELSTWFSEVHSNDPRVVMGLDKMVELGMITTERKTQIITLQP